MTTLQTITEAVRKACPETIRKCGITVVGFSEEPEFRCFYCGIPMTYLENRECNQSTITLAEVLRTIETNMDCPKPVNRWGDLLLLWDLTKPLEGQSEACLQFLSDSLK